MEGPKVPSEARWREETPLKEERGSVGRRNGTSMGK